MNRPSLLVAVFYCFLFTQPLLAQEELKVKNAAGKILTGADEQVNRGKVLKRGNQFGNTANINLNNADKGLLVFDTNSQTFFVWKNNKWVAIKNTPSTKNCSNDFSNDWKPINNNHQASSTYGITSNNRIPRRKNP